METNQHSVLSIFPKEQNGYFVLIEFCQSLIFNAIVDFVYKLFKIPLGHAHLFDQRFDFILSIAHNSPEKFVIR